MRSLWFVTFIVVVGLGAFAHPTSAYTLAQKQLSGQLVRTAEAPTQIWYIDPRSKERVAMTTLTDIRAVLRDRAVKMKKTDLKRIPLSTSSAVGDVAFRRQMAGHFLVVTDYKNQAWYVLPRSKRRIQLGSGTAAVQFMQRMAVTISADRLAALPLPPNIQLISTAIVTDRGTFTVDRLEFAWNDPGLRLMVDTANTTDCGANCPVLSLGSYVTRRGALAAIHGTYFCPQDYAACANKRNSYDFPIWNSFTKTWLNEGRIKYTSQPLVLFDTTNHPFLYTETRQFKSDAGVRQALVADSLAVGGSGVLQAAFSNGPALMKNGVRVLQADQLDTKQATVKSSRGGLGWKGTTMVFFVVHGATVFDSAAVAQSLGLENAVNLDGGGSTALYTADHYVLGPGRNLPNAILVTPR